ncbi:ABC transporter permease [Dyadobacter tibetensis]|uniref:ABC transporter permease n=1 Tax=Dyadobacter tibetensis TaxID=1211851 RepID=UPI000472BA33|nr:ABC transporter permease [Dyadobacter tibetensis]
MIKNYIKIGFRNLIRNKSYVILNVIGLSLGMTAAILIYCIVRYHESFDIFHQHANRIYRVVTEMRRDRIDYTSAVPAGLAPTIRSQETFAEQVARIASFENTQVRFESQGQIIKLKEPAGMAFSDVAYFKIFDFPLLTGSPSSLEEPNTAWITERLVKKYFNGREALGKTLRIDNRIDVTISGILKDLPLHTDQKTEIFISYPTLKQYDEWLGTDDNWSGIHTALHCFVLLNPNVTAERAEQAMASYPKTYRPLSKNIHRYRLQPLKEVHFDHNYGGVIPHSHLDILLLIGLFLVSTASLNFINLATAQSLKRSKEVGIRKVLGSKRGQLFWQFILQTGLLTSFSFLMAIILSCLLFSGLNQLFNIQVSFRSLLNFPFFLYGGGLVLVVTLISGSYPAYLLSGFQPIKALQGRFNKMELGGFNTRRSLIVVQLIISQLLILGMIVITRQMNYSSRQQMGFDRDAVVMLNIPRGDLNGKALKNEIKGITGVRQAAQCFSAPASHLVWGSTPRYNNKTEDEPFRLLLKSVDQDYLSTFGLELLAGRNVLPSDSAHESMVNEAMARKLNLEDPEQMLGKQLNFANEKTTIVGIIKDFHHQSFHNGIEAVALFTGPIHHEQLAVKLNPSQLSEGLVAIENIWNKIFPDLVFEYSFLDESIASFYQQEMLMLNMVKIFSFTALLIASLGLYGLVSYMISQKTKEIGIRKVLGSNVLQVVWIFGREIVMLVVIAFSIAAPLGWMVMDDWLQNFEYHPSIDFPVYFFTLTFTLLAAFTIVSYQTIKASLANPIHSLRSE